MNEINTYKIVNNKGEDIWNYASLNDAVMEAMNLCEDTGESYTVVKNIRSEEIVCTVLKEN